MTVPGGTVTFLFSDIEGSTRLLEQLGDRYAEVHRDHRRILRDRLGAAGGQEVDAQGDAFFFSFARARDAVAAAVEAQHALGEHDWPDGAEVRVRMGVHTGEPTVGDEGYLGLDVVRAARICSAAHGGQILLSETTRALVGNNIPEGTEIRDLGRANLKDVQHERIFQLALTGRAEDFPPLRTPAAQQTSADELGERLGREIERRVEEQILAAFHPTTAKERSDSAGGLRRLGRLLPLVLLVVAAAAILLLVRAAF